MAKLGAGARADALEVHRLAYLFAASARCDTDRMTPAFYQVDVAPDGKTVFTGG